MNVLAIIRNINVYIILYMYIHACIMLKCFISDMIMYVTCILLFELRMNLQQL